MALQVIAPAQGAGAQLRPFDMQVPQFRDFGRAQVADPVGKELDRLTAALGLYAERKRQEQDSTDFAAAMTELQKQAMAFQSQYRQENMGRAARGAADDFARQVNETAQGIEKRFQGRPELQARFREQAQALALRSYGSGFSYADQQEAQYRNDTAQEKLGLLADAIGTGSMQDVDAARQDYAQTLAEFFPGRNLEPELRKADRMVAGGLIDRALAADDIRGARALYNQRREMLGQDAPAYGLRIKNRVEALQAKAEAEANRAARELLKGHPDAVRQAEYFGDTGPLDDMEKRMRALGRTEEADILHRESSRYRSTREAAVFASGQPLPDVVRRITETEAAQREAEEARDADAYERTAKELKTLRDISSRRAKALRDDPAAAVEQEPLFRLPDNATPGDRVAARMEAQRRNGVPGTGIRPLTEQEVETLAGEYGKAPSAVAQQMREAYGEQFPPVLKQLTASGKFGSLNLIADMEPRAGDLLARTDTKDFVKQTEEALGMEKADRDSLKDKVRDSLEDALATFAAEGSPDAAAQVLDASYRLALQYRMQGMDEGDAAGRAAEETFAGRYAMAGSYRVPRQFDAAKVQDGAQAALRGLAPQDIAFALPEGTGLSPEAVDRRIRRTLESSGRWVVNADESGLILTVSGQPVRTKDGRVVARSFRELEGQGGGTEDAGLRVPWDMGR